MNVVWGIDWPEECPRQPELDAGKMHTWHHLWTDTTEGLGGVLGAGTACYVELGTWCGGSAQLAAQLAPRAKIYCVDAWDGRGSEIYHDLGGPEALQLCIANLWEFRDRTTLLQANTLDGLLWLADAGVRPDVIYIDADHHYEAASQDIEMCRQLFPVAILCGDDYDEECGRAADDVMGAENIVVTGRKFWRSLL